MIMKRYKKNELFLAVAARKSLTQASRPAMRDARTSISKLGCFAEKSSIVA